jgi:hypothetical protein
MMQILLKRRNKDLVSLIKYLSNVGCLYAVPMDCYFDVVGGLVPLRCEEGRPKAVRDKVAGKVGSKITELKQFR